MSQVVSSPSLDKTFGAAFCGLLVTTMLYGITSFQTYLYLRRFPKDSPGLKILVWALWFLDTLHVACASHSVYWYVITNYSNPPALADGVWSLFLSLGLNVVIAFIVQCFFTKRVWICRNRTFTTVVAVVVLAHLVFGITTTVEMFMQKELARLAEIKLFPVTPFGVTAVASDIVIAGALCYHLYGVRTHVARRTENLIDTLMIYAVQRCLLTSFFAIVEIICFSALPNTLVFLAIDYFIGKLYANSLLATLNARTSLRGRGNDDEIHSSHAARDTRDRATGLKTRRPERPVSIEFTSAHADNPMSTSGSTSLGADTLSFGVSSVPHTMSGEDKNEPLGRQGGV